MKILVLLLSPFVLESVAFKHADKWIDVGSNYMYYISLNKITWGEAVVTCMKMGFGIKLATFNTKRELDAFGRYLNRQAPNLWMGVYRNSSDSFTRIAAPNSGFFIWDDGEPNNHENLSENCVELRTARMKFNDVPCDFKLGYICETDKEAKSCGTKYRDWTFFDGFCYSAEASIDAVRNWTAAEEYCVARRSHLVSIHDSFEQNFVFKKLLHENHSLHNLWSGLRYKKNETPSWTDESPVDFNQMENPTLATNRCVFLNLFHDHWSLGHCGQKLGFVCKIPYQLTKVPEEDSTACNQVHSCVVPEHSQGGLTVGLVINIFISILILCVLMFFLIKRWPVDPKIYSCCRNVNQTKRATLAEEDL